MSIVRTAAVLTALMWSVVVAFPATAQASDADDAAAFVRDINALRASKGLGALTVNRDLAAVANAWNNKMAQAGTISHNPNLAAQGPAGWTKLGENVGVGGTEISLHNAFVNSPGHYANLVDPKFTEIGVAVMQSGGRMWVVENFMASSVKAAAPVAQQSQASKYAAALSTQSPAIANIKSLRGRTALGQ